MQAETLDLGPLRRQTAHVRLQAFCVCARDAVLNKLSLSEQCRVWAEECRAQARSFRNQTPRLQMFRLAADYERKAIIAKELEIRLEAPLVPKL